MTLFIRIGISLVVLFFSPSTCIKLREQYFSVILADKEDLFGFRILTFNKVRSTMGCINVCILVRSCTIVATRQIDKQTDCLCMEDLDFPTKVSSEDIWIHDNSWDIYAKENTLISVMCLRTSKGTEQAVFSSWTNSTYDNHVDYKDAVSTEVMVNETFRNPLLNNWSKWNIETVELILLTDGSEKIRMVFDGQKANSLSWFSPGRLTSSPWPGLELIHSNKFIITSMTDKSFVIKQFSVNCMMAGWLLVLERPDTCDWVGSSEYPQFLYSPSLNFATFSSIGDRLLADDFVIYITLRIS